MPDREIIDHCSEHTSHMISDVNLVFRSDIWMKKWFHQHSLSLSSFSAAFNAKILQLDKSVWWDSQIMNVTSSHCKINDFFHISESLSLWVTRNFIHNNQEILNLLMQNQQTLKDETQSDWFNIINTVSAHHYFFSLVLDTVRKNDCHFWHIISFNAARSRLQQLQWDNFLINYIAQSAAQSSAFFLCCVSMMSVSSEFSILNVKKYNDLCSSSVLD